MSVSGLVGDCGWGAPFGFWRHPLGLLLVEGASLERLLASEEAYRAATASREIFRVVDRPTLADDAGSMTTFVGLDNRLGLPPFLPVRRGQDLVMGATLWHATRAVYGHVPLALLHAADGRRPFAPGETLRAGGQPRHRQARARGDGRGRGRGPGRRPRPARPTDRADRRALGRDFEALLRTRLRDDAARHAAIVEAALDAAPRAAAWWRDALLTFVAHEHEAANRAEATVPLDLVDGRGFEAARDLAHELVRRFGELLEWWPQITRVAATLHAAGSGSPERW